MPENRDPLPDQSGRIAICQHPNGDGVWWRPAMPMHSRRYILRDDAGAYPGVDDPEKHYGVWDNAIRQYAILPDATYCWGMIIDRALDALNELHGGLPAERFDGSTRP